MAKLYYEDKAANKTVFTSNEQLKLRVIELTSQRNKAVVLSLLLAIILGVVIYGKC